MALKGTLKDFGIADILQLIGQQQKTGVLYLKSKQEEVEVSFLEGHVIRALSKTRKSRELLGSMLVSSGLVSEAELEESLDIQKRTLKRLGDILVAEGRITSDQLRDMAQLQTTETLYKLFGWKNGTYEFVQQDVEHDPAQGAPLKAEPIVMEGFRRFDEWPMVRRRITSMGLSFERVKSLAPPPLAADAAGDEVDAALDAALEAADAPAEPPPRSIGRHERHVFKLADPDFTVQRLCEISRIGEFETCKALYNLVEAGYLRTVVPKKGAGLGEARSSLLPAEIRAVFRRSVVQMAVGIVVVVVFAIVARAFGTRPDIVVAVPADSGASRRVQAEEQQARLQSALELYRLAHGEYPDGLSRLADDRLLDVAELSFPFDAEYHYRRDGDVYVLLPPLR
jgi:hypothetical protein